MERQETTLPVLPGTHIQADFNIPQHTYARRLGMGRLLSRILHEPFATRLYGANISLLRVRGKLFVLPYAPTSQQRDLATAEEYY